MHVCLNHKNGSVLLSEVKEDVQDVTTWSHCGYYGHATCCLQVYPYMMRGHDIKKVAVVGIEGHDVVYCFVGSQLQHPLIGCGHVR